MPSPSIIVERRFCQPYDGYHDNEYQAAHHKDFVRADNETLLGNGIVDNTCGLNVGNAVLGQMSGRFMQRRGIWRDMFGKACMVQRFTPFPQGTDE